MDAAHFGHTVEDAVYVHPAHLRRGTGERLLNAVLNAAKDAGHHCVIAVIDSRQEASVALHVKLGFVESGRLREVGRKFGEWLDLVYLQRLFSTTCFQPAQSAQR